MVLTATNEQTFYMWLTSQLHPNPLNPRGEVNPESVRELVESIAAVGIIQPLVITPQGVVIAGHRRLAAARLIPLETVPVIVRDIPEAEQLSIMIAENLQRQDLTPSQEARAYQRLREMGLTYQDIARQIGTNHSRISRLITLLGLDPDVQAMFDLGEIPLLLVPILARVKDAEAQKRLALSSARRHMTVPQLEEIVRRNLGEINEIKREPKPETAKTSTMNKTTGSRKEALAFLLAAPDKPVRYSELASLFDDVCGICGDCGMAKLEEVCKVCPLPQLIARLAVC